MGRTLDKWEHRFVHLPPTWLAHRTAARLSRWGVAAMVVLLVVLVVVLRQEALPFVALGVPLVFVAWQKAAMHDMLDAGRRLFEATGGMDQIRPERENAPTPGATDEGAGATGKP